MPLSGLHSGQSPPDQTRSCVFRSVDSRSSAKSIWAWAWRASSETVLSDAASTVVGRSEGFNVGRLQEHGDFSDEADTEIGAPGLKRSSLGPGAGTLWRS